MTPADEALEDGILVVDGVVRVDKIGAVVVALVAVPESAPPDATVTLVEEERAVDWLVARLLAICWRVVKQSLSCSCKKSPADPSPPDAILKLQLERRTQIVRINAFLAPTAYHAMHRTINPGRRGRLGARGYI